MSFRHNKKRNSGLVYEFLVRRMASTMVDRDPEGYLQAVGIIKKYFSSGQPLAEEKEIFDVISSSRGLAEPAARRVLSQLESHARALDSKKIEIKKSNLIKDVHYTFGQEFFSVHRVPEYRLLASVQMLVERYRQVGANLTEDVQKIQLEEALVKFMTTPIQDKTTGPGGQKVDGLVASLAMRKFEERYSGVLSESQKKTIRRFMNYSMTGNREQFSREMEEERQGLMQKIKESRELKCFSEDPVMATRLDEATASLTGLTNLSSEDSVQELLLYHKLAAEIDSDE